MNNQEIILGAPGCGKTYRLMQILEEELKTHDPDKLAFVSFTRKGTYEGAERAREKFGFKENDLPYFRTLHSIAFREGKFSKYDIIQKRHYHDFSMSMGMSFTGYYTEEFYNNDDKYLFLTMLERTNPNAAKQFAVDIEVPKLNDVRHNYIKYKLFAHVVDFVDIIDEFIKRNEALPVDVAIIDEAQDLTTQQWRMCEVAFRNCSKVYIAGDDDQAIYEWSGADVKHFLALEGKQEILKQSYRLQKNILDLSKGISKMIEHRIDKEFKAISDLGKITFYNSIDYIPLNKDESYYFLARNNCFLSVHREFLRRNAQVFNDKDKLSIDKREVEAINIFECSRKGSITETEKVRLEMFIKPKVDLTKPWYNNLNFDNDKIAYYKDLIKFKTDLTKSNITVSTIHGVKGGEADNVVLLLDITQSVKLNLENNPDSELRCLYVACTRAKKNLHIVHSNTKNGFDSYIPFNKGV